MTQAIIASPTGTALMPTHGSWRPLVIISVFSPNLVIVLRVVRIDDVGFTAKRTTRSWPVLMPPRMPPAWLELYSGPSGPIDISSALASPVSSDAAMPSPISTPFTALMLIIAAAKSISNFPYIGAPSPAGTPEATTSITAPTELPDLRRPSK